MQSLWKMSVDYGVQILMNEFRPDREFITSNRGLNNGKKSSSSALCEKEISKTEIEMCHMMTSVLRQSIIEHLDISARDLALDPTVELSRLMTELMNYEPLLFKYRSNVDPKTKIKYSRLNKSNDIMWILFGTFEHPKVKNVVNCVTLL